MGQLASWGSSAHVRLEHYKTKRMHVGFRRAIGILTLNDVFFENESLMFVVTAIAAVIAVIILLLAFRRALRCRFRVRARGGNAATPRCYRFI